MSAVAFRVTVHLTVCSCHWEVTVGPGLTSLYGPMLCHYFWPKAFQESPFSCCSWQISTCFRQSLSPSVSRNSKISKWCLSSVLCENLLKLLTVCGVSPAQGLLRVWNVYVLPMQSPCSGCIRCRDLNGLLNESGTPLVFWELGCQNNTNTKCWLKALGSKAQVPGNLCWWCFCRWMFSSKLLSSARGWIFHSSFIPLVLCYALSGVWGDVLHIINFFQHFL